MLFLLGVLVLGEDLCSNVEERLVEKRVTNENMVQSCPTLDANNFENISILAADDPGETMNQLSSSSYVGCVWECIGNGDCYTNVLNWFREEDEGGAIIMWFDEESKRYLIRFEPLYDSTGETPVCSPFKTNEQKSYCMGGRALIINDRCKADTQNYTLREFHENYADTTVVRADRYWHGNMCERVKSIPTIPRYTTTTSHDNELCPTTGSFYTSSNGFDCWYICKYATTCVEETIQALANESIGEYYAQFGNYGDGNIQVALTLHGQDNTEFTCSTLSMEYLPCQSEFAIVSKSKCTDSDSGLFRFEFIDALDAPQQTTTSPDESSLTTASSTAAAGTTSSSSDLSSAAIVGIVVAAVMVPVLVLVGYCYKGGKGEKANFQQNLL